MQNYTEKHAANTSTNISWQSAP